VSCRLVTKRAYCGSKGQALAGPGWPRHNEHIAETNTQRREDTFALDVDALPASRRAREQQAPAGARRLGLVDLDTGEIQDDDPLGSEPRTRTEKGPPRVMLMSERAQAINRAQRALKALGEHPRSSQKELGHAREHLNAGYSHGASEQAWDAVAKVEATAERRYGVPGSGEQRSAPAAAEDLEEPASAGRGRLAEDYAPQPVPARELSRCSED
jgi:hypothetical protein